MKSILLSIKPKYVELIASGKKTIEVRKSAPKEEPFKAYIYCTKDKPYLYRVDDDNNFELTNTLRPKTYEYVKDYNEQNGKVIGEFICDKVYLIKNQGSRFSVADEEQSVTNEIARKSCLDYNDMISYLGNKDGYGWHISNLNIYDEPKKLREFCIPCKTNCENCKKPLFYDCWEEKGRVKVVTRPPQSYMFVEEINE